MERSGALQLAAALIALDEQKLHASPGFEEGDLPVTRETRDAERRHVLTLVDAEARRELLNAFPLKAYELWQKGESLPQPLEEMLKELKDVDERLNLIRAQRFAKLEEKKQQNAEPSPEGASEDEAVTEETAEENVKEAPSAAETEDESAAPLEEGETGDNA